MYHHIKRLMYSVRVDAADPNFGNMLLEQFGGANGELAAAMQYSIQGLNCDDPARKDMLMDIGTEELSHLEIVGMLARLHLQPMKSVREAAEVDPLVAIAGGGGVTLCNSMGNAWTADYLKVTGELDGDLRSNIAAEARAKIVYERLINFCDDAGTKDALQFLMTREITHLKVFTIALESMQKKAFSIGQIPPSPDWVNKYFNDSTGQGAEADMDSRGPWNQGVEWEYVEAPALEEMGTRMGSGGAADTKGGAFAASEMLTETLLEGLQDLLDAEGQLVKALPKMAKAARAPMLAQAFEQHLEETKEQIERLKQVFELLGEKGAAKSCKGMGGLVAEGHELVEESVDKEDIAADLGLIAAAQKVEHYEISSYLGAIALANRAGETKAARLLGQSLLEEQSADKLLCRLATDLMDAAQGLEEALGSDDAENAGDEEFAHEIGMKQEATTAVKVKTPPAAKNGKARGKR